MLNLTDLWLVIVVAGVAAWVASALIHMLLKYHNSDYSTLANEAQVMEAIGSASPAPGFYNFPHCADMAEYASDAMAQKLTTGPVGFLTVVPNGVMNMGKLMGQQVVFFIVACALIAYCATLALPAGTAAFPVMRFVATIAFLTFGMAHVPYSIWYGHPWSTSAKYMLDAAIYAAVIGGVFVWLWPAAGV